MKPEVRQLKRSVRLVQHGCVLSETPRRPGPTHSVFDLLAAAVAALAPEGRLAMLGFAGGGMMAPLRKAGWDGEVLAVDLCEDGHRLYRSVAGEWGGPLAFSRDDAAAWLRRQRRGFAAIVEDLSVPIEDDVVKPEVSWKRLPGLMARKLRPDGVAVANLLPTPGVGWHGMMEAVRLEGRPGVVVELEEFHNRVVIQGTGVGPARRSGARLRAVLRSLGSRAGDRLSVWTLG